MTVPPADDLPVLKKGQTYYDLSGTWVVLRKVDLKAYGMAGLEMAVRNHLAELGLKNAKAGSDAVQASEPESNPRPDSGPGEMAEQLLNQIGQIGLAKAMNPMLINAGLVYPALEDLIALYDGSLELPDYGMGPDFEDLAQAIIKHSEGVVSQLTAEEAERFPETVRGLTGQIEREIQGFAASATQPVGG